MKTKRLFILIWNMGIGGVQKRVRDILLYINRSHPDWEVHLVIKDESNNYFIQSIPPSPKIHFHYIRSSKGLLKNLPTIFGIAYLYGKIKPSVCLTFQDYLSIAMIAIRTLFFWQKTRLILNETANTSRYLLLHRWPLWRILIRIFYRYADAIIVPTLSCLLDLHSNFGIQKDKLSLIPNWTLFRPQKPFKRWHYHCIYVGRLEEEKNPLEVLRVIERLQKKIPTVRCCIIGEGTLENNLRTEIAKRKLTANITLAGFQYDVGKYMRSSKILIVPSINEGLPNIVLEAGMCQLPAIARNFDGAREVIQDGKTGYVTATTKEMTDRVYMLLGNETLHNAMGKSALAYVQSEFGYNNQLRFLSVLLS